MRFLHKFISKSHSLFHHGPFTATIQARFKKPANTAQTRLECRTLDPKLDVLAFHRSRLDLALRIYTHVLVKKRLPFISLQRLSRWAAHAGINTLSIGGALRKYPHVFDVFTHPVRRNPCCTFTPNFMELLSIEDGILRGMVDDNVIKLRKLLSMSVNGRVHLHAIRLMRRELGLPENFLDLIIKPHNEIFLIVDLETVELVDFEENRESSNFAAEVENWRDREYKEKWLSEFETKYSFPMRLPTGFKIMPGFREKLRNWQHLSYVKPYARMKNARVSSCGGVERYEKRAVGIIHELLCLTVEKLMEVERLAHFRKDFGIEVNVRELVLKHPGIFSVSTRGKTQVLFLRDAYRGSDLVEPNKLYDVRRKMLELITMGSRNTKELRKSEKGVEERKDLEGKIGDATQNGAFVLRILESFGQ